MEFRAWVLHAGPFEDRHEGVRARWDVGVEEATDAADGGRGYAEVVGAHGGHWWCDGSGFNLEVWSDDWLRSGRCRR